MYQLPRAGCGQHLPRYRVDIEAGRLQIIAMSDHGQISLSGEPLDLPEKLTKAGFAAAPAELAAADEAVAEAPAEADAAEPAAEGEAEPAAAEEAG